MAYSEYLADRVRPRLKGKGLVEEKKMMGGLTFMVNGKMCLGIMFDKKTEEDKLMVRVGKLQKTSAYYQYIRFWPFYESTWP